LGLKERKKDLETLSEHLLGTQGFYLSTVSMFLFAYGGMVAYMVIIGDSFSSIFQQFFHSSGFVGILVQREVIMIITATIIVLPLCLLRNISSLAWSSLLSVLADVIIVIIVLIISPYSAEAQGIEVTTEDLLRTRGDFFAGIGTMSFAFVCQHQSFLVFNSLYQPNFSRWKQVANVSVSVSFLLIFGFGAGGYLNFGHHVKGDFLNNLPENGTLTLYFHFLC